MNIDEYYIRMEAAALPRAPGRKAGSYGGLPSGTHGTADGGGDVADDCAGIPGWGSDKSRYGSSGRCRGDGACLPVAGLSRPGRARGRGSGCRALFRRQGGGADGPGPRVFVIFYGFSHHIFVRIFLHISLKNLIFSNMAKSVPRR